MRSTPLKRFGRDLNKNSRHISSKIFRIRKEIESLNLELVWQRTTETCPLLEIAGFAEIGPMNSETINHTVYEL